MGTLDNNKWENFMQPHKNFFGTGRTKGIEFRMEQLQILKKAIKSNEEQIIQALHKDLHKPAFEAYATEIGIVYDSINYFLKHLRSWAKPKRVRTPFVHFGSRSYIYSEPYGTVLIIGPFNYPFQLLIEPLVGALSAGNCAVLKPSEYTPHVSKVIKNIIQEHFHAEYIQVVEGGVEDTSALIRAPFDYIFFTGSVNVGKIVAEAAGKRLIPYTLELGGKSPAIVDRKSAIDVAARRIVWGKFINAGQTCVAPDFIVVHRDVEKQLIAEVKKAIREFYGEVPFESKHYGRIINERHTQRLINILEGAKIVAGGEHNLSERFIEPTVLGAVDWSDKVMEEEIFGPILPVITYENMEDIIERINARPKPLALYIFTEDKAVEKKLIESISYGGGCINDTITHLTTPYLPFGGVGSSGIGSYHGKSSFDTFSHKKSILKKSTRINLDFIYPPYTKQKEKLIRHVLK